MEYVEGETLDEHYNSPRSQGLDAIIVTEGIHAENLVLGDPGTPNILLGKDGKIRLIEIDWARGVGSMTTVYKDHPLANIKQRETQADF